jgi:hypothetical protein
MWRKLLQEERRRFDPLGIQVTHLHVLSCWFQSDASVYSVSECRTKEGNQVDIDIIVYRFGDLIAEMECEEWRGVDLGVAVAATGGHRLHESHLPLALASTLLHLHLQLRLPLPLRVRLPLPC